VIAYLDASALVKRYLVELGSRETIALTAESEMIATSTVTRAEVAAALAKAVRAGLVTKDRARSAQRSFTGDWPDLVRL
jgi:predicted nucleic acid-binding protein